MVGPPVMRSALILAGGRSARFGRAKATAIIQGQPMIRRVAEALIPMVGELLVATAREQRIEELRTILPEATFVRDRRQDRGPIEGLSRGLEAAQGSLVLVAPCDAPFLQPRLYDALMGAIGDCDAAVPRLEVIDPLRAVYRREAALHALRHRPAIPSPSALVDRLDAVFLEGRDLNAADPGLASFVDVNRPEDLAGAQHRVSRAEPAPRRHHSY